MTDDPVNHPRHYKLGGIEVIDAIEAWQVTFAIGNVIKYCARAGKKDPAKHVEDLEKAKFYLEREIARLKKRELAPASVEPLGHPDHEFAIVGEGTASDPKRYRCKLCRIEYGLSGMRNDPGCYR